MCPGILRNLELSMAVEWITSRAGGGSDAEILRRIGQRVAQDPLARIIVLVPPQATLMTETHIMHALNLPGLMGVQVMGPEKLAQRILDSVYGRAKPVVDLPAKSMVVKLLLETYADSLPALSACARAQNMSADIARLISEFKAMDIAPQDIGSLQTGNPATDRKYADLAFLYEQFDGYMQNRAITLEDRMNIAVNHVRKCRFIAESDFYILHFDLLTSQLERLFAEIAAAAQNTVLSFLDTDERDPDAGLFEAVRRQRVSVNRMIAEKTSWTVLPGSGRQDAIGHIEKNLYAYPYRKFSRDCGSMQMIRALDPEEETASAAEIIARLVAEEGYAMREIAIVCGNTQEYADYIGQIFSRANIPFFVDDKRSAAENFIAGTILSALELSSGRLSKEKLLAHIELAWGMDEPDVCVLKNYAYQKINSAYQFEKPFADNLAEEARLRLASPALTFRKKAAAAKTVGEKIKLLQEYLSDLQTEEKLNRLMRAFEENGMPASIDYYEQSYKAIDQVLKQAKELLGELPINGYDLALLLKSGFESAGISLIPQGADEVVVGDIGTSRLQDIRALIVLGVNEGRIPNYEEKPGILQQQEKDFLFSEILHIGSASQIAKQKLAIYRILSMPGERLILSYAQTNGEQLQPSPLIARMHELFDIREIQAREIVGGLRENAVRLAQCELRSLADGYAGKDRQNLALLLAREDTKEQILLYEQFAARANQAERLSPARAAELYSLGAASASRFEAYYSCPFRHFVLYGLRAEVPRESSIAGVDVGNFVHGVLDGVARGIKNAGESWKTVGQAKLVELIRKSSDEVRERDFKYTLGPRNQNVLRTVERELYWAVSAIRRHFETASLEMEETEHAFEMDLGGVRLRGIIDRLDVAKVGDETWFKVVDYKTGEKEWSLQDFAEGLSLQLVIYLLAGMEYLRHLGENARPAGADYFTVRLPLLEQYDQEKIYSEFKMQGLQAVEPETAKQVYGFDGSGIVSLKLRFKKDGAYHASDCRDIYTQEEMGRLMQYAKKLVCGAAAEIEAGNVSVAPQAGQKSAPPCLYCDFRSVCMLDDGALPQKKEKQAKDRLFERMGG